MFYEVPYNSMAQQLYDLWNVEEYKEHGRHTKSSVYNHFDIDFKQLWFIIQDSLIPSGVF